ncbi:DUF1566 domain-containing protein [Solidesulfovibrio sp.]|uniref:Lcl domain-containing protein n=1 Tax=Solidesulfovibrio sp. TaxID=2910990 RepID=UPI002B1EC253|nr:DUF1566 domain-containing protein [Solidesulfovibrio sp.]MEA4855325.1 DUF1566 domain-containing protein [Solidesulfovibrio sp.]
MEFSNVLAKHGRFARLARLLAALGCLLVPVSAQAFILPDTVQTKCYDNTQQIPCPTSPSADFYGQDGNYLGAPMALTDNGNGTVTDTNTGLVWQQTPDRTGLDWDNAGAYCAALDTGGHTDWRLPSRREIATLVSYNRDIPTFANLLQSTKSNESFWTSTTYIVDTTQAYALANGTAYMELRSKGTASTSLATRCVRGDALPAFTPTDNGTTITDTSTGTMWTKNSVTTGKTWQQALGYCETLEAGGHTDWRLPNIAELYSLFDDTRTNPALPVGFGNVGNPPVFWSSTSENDLPDYAMVMGVYNEGRSFRGKKATGIGPNEDSLPMLICVRSGPSLAPTLGSYAAGAVTAPAAGASLYFATNATLQWNATAIAGSTVDLYAINDSLGQIDDTSPDAALAATLSAVKFASGVANSGSHTFSPNALNVYASTVKILVVSNSGNWGMTQGTFSVASAIAAPVAAAATNVTPTSFTANWAAVNGATTYLLYVYDATIKAYVSGFNGRDVGNVTTYAVTGLTPGHTYRYGVKAKDAYSTSNGSNVIEVKSPAGNGAPTNLLLLDNGN